MKVLIAGGTGFVGTALQQKLKNDGNEVIVLSRKVTNQKKSLLHWDPMNEKIDAPLPEVDAVINLAGSSIAQRWTDRIKSELRESRIRSTKFLIKQIKQMERLPKVFINASAIGYYGTNSKGNLPETTPAGSGFLADLCRDWEQEAMAASALGIRTVIFRIGLVLGLNGGALAKMLPAFRLGLGGRLGRGTQWVSWIALSDLIDLFNFSLQQESMNGAYNAVAPELVTNIEFTRCLGKALNRPTIFPMPAFFLKLLFGEMAEQALLADSRCIPERTLQADYKFRYPELGAYLAEKLM